MEKLKNDFNKNQPLIHATKKNFFQQKNPELSIILPCRNEEQALPKCLIQIKEVLEKHKINAEIIISDSSIDKSPEIAKKFADKLNLKLIKHYKEGYGNAYIEAFKYVKSPYVFMADCDGTYDFNEIPNFLNELKKGYDFVIGNRFSKKLQRGVMPWTHKYIGNPLLSGLLRLFYGTTVRDSHCGMRAIKTDSLSRLKLQTAGMEFASEMVIKALKNRLKIKELPIEYYKRIGKSKLNTLSDGWRHLRFMLLYSPLFLFFIPGFIMFILGILTILWIYFGSAQILGIKLYIHPMFFSSLLIIIGYQLMIFALFAKTYAITHLGEKSPLEKYYRYITIENASIFGILLILSGALIYISVLIKWIKLNYSSIDEIKNLILGLTIGVIGIQTIFSSFMLSILGVKER